MTVWKANLYGLGVLVLIPVCMLCTSIKRDGADWGLFFGMLFFILFAWGIGIFLGVVLAAVGTTISQ